MATIDNKKIIDEIIAGDGHYQGDERVYMIVEYENAWGNTTWGVTWEYEMNFMKLRYMEESEYVRNPRVLWSQTQQ